LCVETATRVLMLRHVECLIGRAMKAWDDWS
jgi:hypothetical protein